ncbi:putative peptide zinc metalloprotease protein [Micromonospora pallida]|uniref:Putative peptide zinc metalloprotease protein n=1 Tax=Micromonospora pallida TaxID=145854 RepID=A0A1C6RQG5_9ACTN|nr:M50 family metallopeptidase [Micromonospora pallida]SCL19392.1 putative peptide zinc metalloprotease protein [Micromonospora pallida]
MTTVETTWTRPRLRPGIVLGPGQWRGEKLVHHVKDPETGWYYRVGPREHFLLARMDGTRTLDELAAEYAEVFHRRLGPESWQQLFGMLHRRQLLDGATDPAELARLAATAAESAAKAKRGPLSARIPLFDPERLFDRVLPALRPVFTWWFVIPALATVLALIGYVALHLSELTAVVTGGHRPLAAILAAVVITWAIVFLHECAHGLACRHFGGRVTEIGMMWRFPIFAPYCKVDDVVLFTPRRRVATAFAGIFVSLLALLPFAAIWLWADPGVLRDLAATILLFGTAAASIGLVPFLRLDGYYMLSHALNLVDLRADSYQFWGRLLRGGPRTVAGYRPRDRVVYATYGLASLLFGVTLLVLLVRYWYVSLATWTSPFWAVTILAVEAVLVVAAIGYLYRRRARAATDEGAPEASTPEPVTPKASSPAPAAGPAPDAG